MKKKKVFIVLTIFLMVFVIIFLFVNNFGRKNIASLLVNSNVVQEVLIDGKDVGKTPYEGILDAKEVTVQVGNYETKVQLQAGIKTIINRDFNQDNSYGEVVSFERTALNSPIIAVVSNPSGALITVDGSSYGFTPLNIDSIPAGVHQLNVVADGYVSRDFSINLITGYKLVAAIDLAPLASEAQNLKKEPTQQVDQEKSMVEILETPNGFLRVREQPTIEAKEIARVKAQEKYDVLSTDQKTGWFEIALNATMSGWISNSYAGLKPN